MSDVTRTVRLPPDPGLVSSLGARHSLETALADLVDNGVDAGARRVLIVFEIDADRLSRILVFDDGSGMDEQTMDRAMTLGHRREYEASDLGHFGLGMKSASFAHADTLTVWSSSFQNDPVGRRIQRADFSRDFTCQVLSEESARAAHDRRTRELGRETGSIVEWSALTTVYRGSDAREASSWLFERQTEVRAHLGITFHRLLESDRLSISIRTDEAGLESGAEMPVRPVDPFGYRNTGKPGYPKVLTAELDGTRIKLECHIWPPKSSAVEYRLRGTGEEAQGFFVYRNDRLLQVGGWDEVASSSSKRRLARVRIEGDAIGSGLTMNAEKQGLRFSPDYSAAIHRARAADGTDFQSFLADAESVQVQASKRNRARPPAVMPEKGFAPGLRRVISDELPSKNQPPLDIRWSPLPEGDFFDVDLHDMTLRLNDRYRRLFVPGRAGLNDAPVLKAALYLLAHDLFEGEYLGPRDKDRIALYQAVLTEAALIQEKTGDGRR